MLMKVLPAALLFCSTALWSVSAQTEPAPEIAVSSSAAEIALSVGKGAQWSRIVNKGTGAEYVLPGQGQPIFAVEEGGVRLLSTDFQFVGEQRVDNGKVLILENTEHGWKAALKLTLDDSGKATLGLTVENLKAEARRPQVLFPIVGALGMGGELESLAYFFPWRTGVTGTVDCRLSHEYGNLAWMQVVAFYNGPNGLSIFPKDNTGRFKGIQFRKGSGKGGALVRHSESIMNREQPRSPLNFGKGAGVAYYYLPRPIDAKGRLELPDTAISIYSGDWRPALNEYAAWVRTWYNKVKTPQWFMDSFTFAPVHPAGFWSEKEKRYIQSELATGNEDVVQWAFWHDFPEGNDPSDSQGESVVKAAFYGDYDYNKARGGLPAFKEEIQKLQARGIRFTVYTDPRFCWQETRIGKAKGEEWAAMYSPGEYGYYATPLDKWMMPLYDTTGWLDYFAETCKRIVRDTGMDGIYLDELMIAFPDYHPGHVKNYGGDDPVPIPLLAAGVTKIRKAVQEANPEAIIMTEHAGSDFMTQFIDGSWMQTFYSGAFGFAEENYDDTSIVYFRFMFPEFKLAQWGDSKDGVNRCFFNGIGSPYYHSLDLHAILTQNADAFRSLTPEPLIPTAREKLLANRFPQDSKTVYTIYNKTGAPVNEAALPVEKKSGRHYVDLRNRLPLAVEDRADGRFVQVRLGPGEVTAIAELPELLSCERTENGWKYTISGDTEGLELVYGMLGTSKTETQAVSGAQGEISRSVDSARLHVKLMKEGILRDYWIEK